MKYALIDHAWSDPDYKPRFEIVESGAHKNVRFRGSFESALNSAIYLNKVYGGLYKVSCRLPHDCKRTEAKE